MSKRLYVLSIDAMVSEDMDFMRTMPNLGKFLKDASYVKDITSVYPTLTYVIHASMLTGVYPDRHHVSNNEVFTPGVWPAPWYWNRNVFDSDVTTVIDEARKAGMSTACISWPVTCGLKADYLLPEVWNWQDGSPETMYDLFVKGGADPKFLDEIWEDYGKNLNGLSSPYFDMLAHGAAITAIRNHQPEVMFEHLSMVDHTRHRKGVFASDVYKHAYWLLDLMFGQTMDAMREAGVLDDTVIVITSDHGQTPVDRVICPNIRMIEDGFVRIDENGKLVDWDAFIMSSAHSAQVFLKDNRDEKLKENVRKTLQKYRAEGLGIDRILEKEELKERYHLEGEFSFMIEGADGVTFSNNLTGPLCYSADNSDYKYSIATHGHMPEKGPKPAFIMKGPGIRKNMVIEGGNIVNEAPTLASILGLELPGADGTAWTEFLDDQE